MGRINKLPRDLIEKIAAGEVVERPSSVVKELVENSIDAGARLISVDIAGGGKERIAVIDDGSGMDVADLAISILRHASSKISCDADLTNIRTMGFRGEALAAIGAVSRLSIESKLNDPSVLEGAKICVDGGVATTPAVIGCPGGTKIAVSDLFFNVPARKKFLRSTQVEYGHVSECVTTLALAYPEIRFEFTHDRRRVFVSGADDVQGRMIAVIGEGAANSAVKVSEESAGISINGFVSERGHTAGKNVHIFLNKRPVRDRMLMHAVTAAFGERLGRGGYPAAVLWLSIDPAEVDVNVHPAKREVRFAGAQAVHDFVMNAVRKANNGVKSGHWTSGVCCPMSRLDPIASPCAPGYSGYSETQAPWCGVLRPIGQLGKTYIVCEDPDGTLVLIDQHAAHERLGFDALKKQYASGSVKGQRLLIPERVELGEKGAAYIMEHGEAVARTGFEIEPFGGRTIMIKSVPAILGGADVGNVFCKMAGELEEFGSSHSIDEVVERIFAVVACHRQVRGGDRLAPEEVSRLVRDVEQENITHCPHGRPALVKIEKGEIEKWFKRS